MELKSHSVFVRGVMEFSSMWDWMQDVQNLRQADGDT